MRQRTVLFIVTSFWAFGELAIATEFARRMAGTGFTPLFLIPPTHRRLMADSGLAYQVMIPGAGKINRIQLRDIAHVHQPALVVLADFMNFDFCDRHYGLGRADLAAFDCPVGTFDDFSWGRDGAWLDTYGFKAKYEGDITLDGLSFRLRPCPLNNPLDETGPDVFAYPLLEETADVPTAQRDDVRAELGLTGGRPVVMVTGATWQRMHAAYPRVTAYVDASHRMLERLLERILPHADVLAVGPQLVFHDRTPTGFHPLGQVEPERFRRLIQAVDLHISNNIVSVSLHRLALRGIPSVVLMNSLNKRRGRLRWEIPAPPELTEHARGVVDGIDYLYPCRMFPVGWYHFLRSLLDGNPFSAVVEHVETFDEDGSLAAILPLLEDGPQRERLAEARETYLEALRKLPEVDTILHQVSA
ncbi:DUF6365 family protein [Catellatospora bangladeshensis]|uniref:Uncharacterized protein n=1 Tax=Catellatospora bangladeshensis TaxID=310355 RepID=A0A8J3JM49_9ACTN|nr:DUF6365 family protein [Catellatospora bangladeshensis]GIF80464.1 hypothetical protein Cba03nite_18130 [Catellatospora bangladeshensis]